MSYHYLLPLLFLWSCGPSSDTGPTASVDSPETAFLTKSEALLREWSDAMVELQINSPDDTTRHGALDCPGCDKIHGRCMDAVYPLMYMADATGEEKYMKAAIDVMRWSENVSRPDGSWTVIPNPNSWRGITVFGAIALAEALQYHGHLLPTAVRTEWMDRLARAGTFIYENFTMTYSHVNYGFTAVYALHLLGEVLEEPRYRDRAAELAREIPHWLTPENQLLFGEDKPADKRSAKGLLPVDLGYNVEESLNGVVLYARASGNDSLLHLLQNSLESHLAFMLPDGAWDNSWGTRQNKWSYWGSRTTDGCQPAFGLLAADNPALGTAAYRNLELLDSCTVDGLLAGGPHYDSHGVKPCVHHTFAHAKSLAFLLDHREDFVAVNDDTPLPREEADGVRHFPELDVWLLSRGPWRGTVSSYDNVFKTAGSNQATGGALSVLWHEKVGLVLTASMAKYLLAEKNNQQPQPGKEFALTPRVELNIDDKWYTNLYDLNAEVTTQDDGTTLLIEALTTPRNAERQPAPGDPTFRLEYATGGEAFTIKTQRLDKVMTTSLPTQLVVPLISASGEEWSQPEPGRIIVEKPGGRLIMECNLPLVIEPTDGERIFNMVPGVECIPVTIPFSDEEVVCQIWVE